MANRLLSANASGCAATRCASWSAASSQSGSGVVGQLGHLDRAAQALVDAGAAGKQRVGSRLPGGVALPHHFAPRRAQAEHPVHRAADRRPHGQAVLLVAGHQVLMPGPDGDVRRVVAFRRPVGHPAAGKGPGPRPVGALRLPQPPVGPPSGLAEPAGAQGHRALDVIPHVDVAVRPGNRPGGLLQPRDRLPGREHLGPAQREEPCRLVRPHGPRCPRSPRAGHSAPGPGLTAYTTRLFPIRGLSACSASRVAAGLRMRSQTSMRW